MIVHVRDFGKIVSDDIDLGSLTVFVGENNSGKTYVMQLIYGLLSFFREKEIHRFYEGFFELKFVEGQADIKAQDTKFYTSLQDELNKVIAENKEKIIEKIFHTKKINIGALYVEFGEIENDYSVACNDEIKGDLHEARKSYIIYKNSNMSFGIDFSGHHIQDIVDRILRREVLVAILSDLIGLDLNINHRRADGNRVIYLPASRSGIMLLYANYLADDQEKEISEIEIVEGDEGYVSENEYGLTEPVYNFLMFLLKYKSSEMVSDQNKELISFIDTNIINGSFEQFGNTMRYKPTSSQASMPIYLSSSLVSELASIYQILSGVQRYQYILYDEIETCQHPTKQIQLARLLVRMVNKGYRMIVSTHSDTMAAAINNLITLSFKENKEKLVRELGYEEADLLESSNIKAYQFVIEDGKTKVVEIPSHFSVGIGFDFDLFNLANDKIYADAVALAEEE